MRLLFLGELLFPRQDGTLDLEAYQTAPLAPGVTVCTSGRGDLWAVSPRETVFAIDGVLIDRQHRVYAFPERIVQTEVVRVDAAGGGELQTFTQTSRFTRADGSPVIGRRTAVERKLSCRSRPPAPPMQPEPFDANQGWDDAPGYNTNRCRSSDGQVALITTGYGGGVAPGEHDVVGSITLALDGQVVVRESSYAGVPPAVDSLVDESIGAVLSQHELRWPSIGGHRSTQVHVLRRLDGSAVVGDRTRIEATLTCDRASYPPVP